MLITVASFLAVLSMVYGWGILTAHLLQKFRFSPDKLAWQAKAILGLFSLAVLASITGIFWPLASGPNSIFFVVGFGYGAFSLWHNRERWPWGSVARDFFLGLAFCVLANRGWMHIDTGGYHNQMVSWMALEPLPFGLGNLHSRYGFNSVWHTLVAAFYLPGLGASGAFVGNSVLGFLFFSFLFREFRLSLKEFAAENSALFTLAFLGGTFFSLTFVHAGRRIAESLSTTPSTDFPALCLLWFAWIFFLKAVREKKTVHTAVFVCAFCLALGVKFSVFFSGLLLIPLLWWGPKLSRKQLTVLGSMAVLFGVTWMLRTLILTGCLLYPMPASCFPTYSAMPVPAVQFEYDTLRAWARIEGPSYPYVVLENWDWIPKWIQHNWRDEILRYAAYVWIAAVAALAVAGATIRRKRAWSKEGAALAVVATLSLLLWFVQAPNPRYHYAAFLGAPLACLALGLGAFREKFSFHWRGKLSQIGLTLATLSLIFFIWKACYNAKGIKAYHLTEPWPHFPATDLEEKITTQGSVIHREKSGYCWNTEPAKLCTPTLNPDLRAERRGTRWIFSLYK